MGSGTPDGRGGPQVPPQGQHQVCPLSRNSEVVAAQRRSAPRGGGVRAPRKPESGGLQRRGGGEERGGAARSAGRPAWSVADPLVYIIDIMRHDLSRETTTFRGFRAA